MFNKKNCPNCKKKINKAYSFCPSCGYGFNSNKRPKKEEWGMLGKEDILNDSQFPDLLGGFGGKMMGKMLNNAIRMMEKEMQRNMEMQKKMTSQNPKNPRVKSNFELYINGKRINPENIKITQHPLENSFGNQISKKPLSRTTQKSTIKNVSFSQENRNTFSKLEKKEPKTSIRRLSNKIIYEIEVPGVESIDNVSINQLDSSIEIKAIGKTAGYEKIIPINFPISSYELSEGKLILELKAN